MWQFFTIGNEASNMLEMLLSIVLGSASLGVMAIVEVPPRVRLAGRIRLGWPALSEKHCSHEQCFQPKQGFPLTTISRNSILAYFSVVSNKL